MKKILKFFIIIAIFFVASVFAFNVKLYASSYTPTESGVLSVLNESIEITEGMYDDYTDSEEIPYWADFYSVNIYNYNNPDYGFCGFYMDYTSKPWLLGKGEGTIHGDDPIIYLIPRELFIHRGTHTYVGKEYGFFVNTREFSNSGELKTANLVDVFIFDIIVDYNKNDENFTYTIRPLYIFTYVYLSEYIFYEYEEVTIERVKLSLDSNDYSTFSDVIIPFPKMNDDRDSNQWGNTYLQNYDATQPNKNLYAIKDTFAFIKLTNTNILNTFDEDYDVTSDTGYNIGRSYVTYSGYGASSVGVDVETANQSAWNLLEGAIGLAYPPLGVALEVASYAYDVCVVREYMFGDTYIGYELKTQQNNPSEVYIGGREEQISKYNALWKSDAKSTTSSSNNALVFKTPTYDEIWGWPIYNEINYCWDFDYEIKNMAYLSYGSRIQIAIANESEDTFDEIGIGYSSYNMIIGEKQNKPLTILNGAQGYMLKNGEYDNFSFSPDYSGYYKVNAPSYSNIKLYENNILKVSGYGNVSYIFDKEKSYEIIVEIGSFPQNSRIYNVSIEPYLISTSSNNLLNQYFEVNNESVILKVNCTKTNIYNVNIYNTLNSLNQPLSFQIYDHEMNDLEKFYIDNFNNIASSSDNVNGINIYMEQDNYYYIVIDFIESGDVFCNINEIDDELFNDIDYELESVDGDNLSFVEIIYDSNYFIEYNFVYVPDEDSDESIPSNNMSFVLFKYSNENIELLEYSRCNSINGQVSMTVPLKNGDMIYFGYFNGVENFDYYFKISESPNLRFTITTETETATEVSGLGTEITVNNGERGLNTIAEGFTRVLYLGSNAPYNSRYNDYTWHSTNTSVATVSAYGTVFAKKAGTTTIRVTDKYGNNYVATIEIIVYSQNSESNEVILTTDMNENPLQNGTEVRLNGGVSGDTTIHVGYTRSICIVENGPTNIRQDYTWTSSDPTIANVDMYGFVYARKAGTVTITCINKYDNSYVGTITIVVV